MLLLLFLLLLLLLRLLLLSEVQFYLRRVNVCIARRRACSSAAHSTSTARAACLAVVRIYHECLDRPCLQMRQGRSGVPFPT
eukprot:5507870-Pyramimonas_sp.AAC.1